MLQMKWLICLSISFAIATGCSGQNLEQKFFDIPPANRLQRLRDYSLEDQYRIFRYGNDRIEPPIMELAKPIAERGKAAVPFLHTRLRAASDDQTVRDILLLFQTMIRLRTYNVRADLSLMADLRSKVSDAKNRPWGVTCKKMLDRIEGGD